MRNSRFVGLLVGLVAFAGAAQAQERERERD